MSYALQFCAKHVESNHYIRNTSSLVRLTSRQTLTSNVCSVHQAQFHVGMRSSVGLKKARRRTVIQCDLIELYPNIFRAVFVPADENIAPFSQCILSSPSKRAQIYRRFGDIPELGGVGLTQRIREELRGIKDNVGLEKPPCLLPIHSSLKQRFILISLFHAIFNGGYFQLQLEEVDAEYRRDPVQAPTSLREAVNLHYHADHDSAAKF
ncbi:peptide synthetase [Macrophomina phaseolina MS6]|uniref:Peptide synthetase n=1 Tax=Macrophomina phaseolina (strain MS6) TaxID=1126212 RepID=K2SLA0_MACPH|nr:peptide synthetase [Macrophomina phaseolina MS6]